MNDPEATLESLLASPENVYWAWNKFQKEIRYGNVLYDEMDVAQFEVNIEQEFKKIIGRFKKLEYRMSPIRPLPHPKKPHKDGNMQARQAFSISVRDQVAWIAFVNIIGPWLEEKMPPWSYGNRLYRAVWIDDEEDKHYVRLGWYRHTARQIYRKFRQSWPVYRRHVFLTAKAMTKALDPEDLDEPERRVYEAETYFAENEKLPYLKPDYWKVGGYRRKSLYWAGVDLKKFFPSINLECVLKNLTEFSDYFPEEINKLAKSMLLFPMNLEDYSEDELRHLGLNKRKIRLSGIPTGLQVAGFLANVAMLEVDKKIDQQLLSQCESGNPLIAHFRYVDDHIFLSRDFEALMDWIGRYKTTIQKCKTGASINDEKTEPEKLKGFLKNEEGEIGKNEAIDACTLDPQYPSPLMTKTLGLVSNLARIEFDILQQPERENFINELEHLLLAEFPDREIRPDTRMSFASTRLSWYGPRVVRPDRRNLCDLERKIVRIHQRKKEIDDKIKKFPKNSKRKRKLVKDRAASSKEKRIIEHQYKELLRQIEKESKRQRKRIFHLLMKAVHEYPDKIVLWTRVLQFCQYAGHDDLKRIFEEIKVCEQKFALTAPYIMALVKQVMANQIMKCAAIITDSIISIHDRRAALSYLRAIIASQFVSESGGDLKFFERSANDLFQCALGSASLVLGQFESDEVFTKEKKGEIAKFMKSAISINWTRAIKSWPKRTGYALPLWVWWAEKRMRSQLDVDPGQIWLRMAKKLDLKDPFTWHVWSLYPKHLLEVVGMELFFKESFKGNKYLGKEYEGWLYEVFSEKSGRVDSKRIIKQKHNSVKRVLKIIDSDKLFLYKWTEWTKERFQNDPFDPRISEWTAVAIIDRLLDIMEEEKQTQEKREYQLHPANIIVPKEWTNNKRHKLTWESWQEEFNYSLKTVKIKNAKGVIHDQRFNPSKSGKLIFGTELIQIRALGMLLLGLISRTFTWPVPWNFVGHEMAGSVFGYARRCDMRCSSWTTAILEACLLPRPKETLFLEISKQKVPTDDTTLDPPRISNIEKLHVYVRKAKEVLKANQITAQDHMPRQLTPVKLQQLTRPNWSEDFEHQQT